MYVSKFSTKLFLAGVAGLLFLSVVARAEECGSGVELHLSAPESAQGSVLLAELQSANPLTEPKGEWTEREVSFWQEKDPEMGGHEVWRALLGVDLEEPPGKYEFAVRVHTQGGDELTCKAVVEVRKGHFAIERLHVAEEFVQPNPEQLARAEEEAKRLHEIFDHVTPERLWQGKFRLPLDHVTTGGNFGKRRILNGQPRSPHSGVDFPAAMGTPVHAAQSGQVVLAEELFFSGNTIVVDHGLGIYTFYGHLSEISVKDGNKVEAGAILGKVGATGRVTGPHLHWGVTVGRARVNGLDLVKLLAKE